MGNFFKIHTGTHWTEKVFFRVSHPIFPTVLFGALGTLFIWIAQSTHHYSLWVLPAAFTVGLFLWTVIEYILHRFVFHWTSVKEPWKTLFSGLHMAHHRDTKDPSLIIAPPTLAIIDTVFFFLVLWGLTWSWGLTLIIIAGIYGGYIFYEWVHFGSHEYNWNHGLLGYLKKYHLRHHFRYPNELFGVTQPLWDNLLGTHR